MPRWVQLGCRWGVGGVNDELGPPCRVGERHGLEKREEGRRGGGVEREGGGEGGGHHTDIRQDNKSRHPSEGLVGV